MVRIETEYLGALRCDARHGPSASTLSTDAPKDNLGRGETFSPTDLVATALATCAITTMAIVAQQEGIPFVGARASIEKQMIADPKRRIGALPMTLVIHGEYTDAQRTRLEEVARTCPVAMSLRDGLADALEITFG